jgi:hypothetical protein
MHLAGDAVDDDRVARARRGRGFPRPRRRRGSRARGRRWRRGWSARPPPAPGRAAGAVVVEQRPDPSLRATMMALSGSSVAASATKSCPDQLMQQAVGEIVEIVQPLAQIRVGLAQHPRAGVVLHALDGGLRGEAGHHASRMRAASRDRGEHAEGLRAPRDARRAAIAALQQLVDEARRLDRGFQPLAPRASRPRR